MMYSQSYRPRISFGGAMTPCVRGIMIATAVVFVIQTLCQLTRIPFNDFFGLIPAMVTGKLYFWQLVTYNFLHGGVFHVLMNMLVLYMFGADVEEFLGFKRFLIYYLICGIGAGIVTVIFSSQTMIPVVGASGAIYGLLMAYGILFPHRQVLFMLIFPIKVKWMVLIFIGIEFFGTMDYSRDGISHITHLGGLLFGFVYFYLFVKKNVLHSFYRTSPRSATHRARKQNIFIVKNDEYQIDEEKKDDEFTIH
jgi:membrane associated rhomboid family serine protease